MPISRTITLDLNSDQEDRINRQLERLKEHKVSLSKYAEHVMFLAIAAVVKEPSRYWPDFILQNDELRTNIQNEFIEAFAFEFLSLGSEIYKKAPTADNPYKIDIFDAIDAIANDKWATTWCRITAAGQT